MPKNLPADAPPADLDEIADRFESEWNPGVDVADYLPAAGAPNRIEIAAELIRVDMEYRWKSGEHAMVEDYLKSLSDCEFPPQAINLLAFEEYRLRIQFAEPVSREQFAARLEIDVSRWPVWSGQQTGSDFPEGRSGHNPDLPEVGQSFHGYELVGILGQGAFGRVYLARQSDLANRFVALKVTAISDNEPHSLARLQHTNIVPIFSMQRANDLQSICMPFLGLITIRDLFFQTQDKTSLARSGRDLISTVVGQKASTIRVSALPSSQPEPEVEAVLNPSRPFTRSAIDGLNGQQTMLWMFARITEGLAFAHSRDIIHGDMKPGNILIGDDGQPLILDFHLASSSNLPARSGYAGGTLPYMSGRHLGTLTGQTTIDPSCDIFSVGVMMYEALTGQLPFPGRGTSDDAIRLMIQDREQSPPRVRALNPRISTDVESIVERCIHPDIECRYATAEQIRIDIDRHLGGLPLQFAPNRSVVERAGKWMRRHPRLSSITMMAFLGTLIALTLAALIGSRISSAARIHAVGQSQQFVESLNNSLVALTVPQFDELRAARTRQELKSSLDQRTGATPDATAKYRSMIDGLPKPVQDAESRAIQYATYWLARSTFTTALNSPKERSSLIQRALGELNSAKITGEPLPRAFVQLQADLYRQAGDSNQADSLLKTAGQSGKNESLSLEDQLLAAAEFRRSGDSRKAVLVLSALLASNPKDYRAWLMKGHSHLELHELDRAVECYSMCIGLEQDSPWGWFQRGFTFLEQGNFAAAKSDFSHCLELDPDDSTSLLNRALTHRGMGDNAAAIEDLSRAIDLGCSETRAWYLRYQLRRVTGDNQAAQSDLESFLKMKPNDVKSWLARGMAQMIGGNKDQALADFQSALELDPQSTDAWQNIATMQGEYLNDTLSAIDAMTEIVKLRPDDAVARVTRGVLFARIGKRTEAHADAMAALRIRADADILFRSSGVFSLTSKVDNSDAQKATGMLRKAAFLDPQLVLSRAADDSDLEPIRDLEEYMALIRELKVLSQ